MNYSRVLVIVLIVLLALTGCTKNEKKKQSSLPPQKSKTETKKDDTSPVDRKHQVKEMYAKVADLNIRSGPGTMNPIIQKVGLNTKLEVSTDEMVNGWVKVILKDKEGWVNYNLLSDSVIQAVGDKSVLGWGFRRKSDHTRPEFGKAAQLADKYGVIYVGNSQDKVVYLTFDEGYENGYTTKILDTLKEKGVPAAFFVTAPYVRQEPELVQRMFAEGHVVGNHTVHHRSLPSLSNQDIASELSGVEDVVREKTGYTLNKFVRPPMGEYNERVLSFLQQAGYKCVFWSMAYSDWDTTKQAGAQRAVNHVLENVHPGAVILLHAVSKDNADALGEIIDDLRAQGYRFESLKNFH